MSRKNLPLQMRRLVFSCLGLILLGGAATAGANPRQTSTVEPPSGFVSARMDNDAQIFTCFKCGLLGDEDRGYTQSLAFEMGTTAYNQNNAPFYVAWLQGLGHADRFALGLGVVQEMYTPIDLVKAEIQPLDQPYAGWLHVDITARLFWYNSDGATKLMSRLSPGVIGPDSKAGAFQRWWHGVQRRSRKDEGKNPYCILDPNPNGWVIDEMGGGKSQFRFQWTNELEREISRIHFGADRIASLSWGADTSIGMLEVAGTASAIARVGKINRAWPVASNTGSDLFAFGRVNAQGLLHSEFFKGGNDREILYRHGIFTTELGVALQLAWIRLAWSINTQSQVLLDTPPLPATGIRAGAVEPRNFWFDHIYGRLEIGATW